MATHLQANLMANAAGNLMANATAIAAPVHDGSNTNHTSQKQCNRLMEAALARDLCSRTQPQQQQPQ